MAVKRVKSAFPFSTALLVSPDSRDAYHALPAASVVRAAVAHGRRLQLTISISISTAITVTIRSVLVRAVVPVLGGNRQQDVAPLPTLGEQGELVVAVVVPAQCVHQHVVHVHGLAVALGVASLQFPFLIPLFRRQRYILYLRLRYHLSSRSVGAVISSVVLDMDVLILIVISFSTLMVL